MIKFVKNIFSTFGVFLLLTAQLAAGNNIVEIAVSDDRFTTLVDLVLAAGLGEALQDPNAELTVFAPTNEAFAKLSPEILSYLSNNVDALTNVLLYHVLPTEVFSNEIENNASATTLLDADVKFSFGWFWSHAHHWWRYGLFINGDAHVSQADIDASNGVIHVIDSVLIPPVGFAASKPTPAPTDTIADAVAATGELETLLAAVSAAGLVETLQGNGPFTVFAPVNDAFAKLPAETINDLLADPEGDLTNILLYHVIAGYVSEADIILSGASGARMLNEDIVGLNFDGTTLSLSDSTEEKAKVVQSNIFLKNGVVHLIDKVLIPPQECPYKNRIWCWLYGYGH